MRIFGQPIIDRMNWAAPGANLALEDVASLISLCGFDSVINEYASPWCALFTEGDYAGFEYLLDLGTYYNNGCVSALYCYRIPQLNGISGMASRSAAFRASAT